MMNAAELLSHVPDVSNTKVGGFQLAGRRGRSSLQVVQQLVVRVFQVSGTLIGCIVDTSVGELSFHAAEQDTGVKFKAGFLALVVS